MIKPPNWPRTDAGRRRVVLVLLVLAPAAAATAAALVPEPANGYVQTGSLLVWLLAIGAVGMRAFWVNGTRGSRTAATFAILAIYVSCILAFLSVPALLLQGRGQPVRATVVAERADHSLLSELRYLGLNPEYNYTVAGPGGRPIDGAIAGPSDLLFVGQQVTIRVDPAGILPPMLEPPAAGGGGGSPTPRLLCSPRSVRPSCVSSSPGRRSQPDQSAETFAARNRRLASP